MTPGGKEESGGGGPLDPSWSTVGPTVPPNSPYPDPGRDRHGPRMGLGEGRTHLTLCLVSLCERRQTCLTMPKEGQSPVPSATPYKSERLTII